MTVAPSGIGTVRPGRDDPRALDQDHAGTHELVGLAVEEPGGPLRTINSGFFS